MARNRCVITNQPCQLHHVVGASYKSNKVWVGQWYVIPLSPELHMDGNVNVTTNKADFYKKVGSEKKLFWWSLADYVSTYKEMPVPVNVLVEIYFSSENIMYETESIRQEQEAQFQEFILELNMHGLEDIANETRKLIETEKNYR